ncbi:MAG: VCBS repeat-containing protein [Candidatus Magnetomorum sp.]|nr:VCBS repeat-containing protein [Candidatus Magnetomorum sp.]
MIIQSSSIQMNATHFQKEKHTEMDVFRTFGNGGVLRFVNGSSDSDDNQKDRLSLSKDVEAFLQDIQEKIKDAHQSKEDDDREVMGVKNFMVKQILEAVFGKEIKVIKSSDLEPETQTFSENLGETIDNPQNIEPGTEYIHQESHYEYEAVSFSAEGKIRTDDGKEIAFSLQMAMSRETYSESTFALREGGQPIDPLVINYAGSSADLTDQKFLFDLDADGTMDEISFVTPGSGFLVFDKNQDGIIQDGSELFGPTTGNGFAELAQYDLDRNGWIDENDTIYDQLSIWSKNQKGEDRYQTLKQTDVGAIYLSAAQTSFAYKDFGMNTHGSLNQSGVYFTESGQPRLIQQLDLVA